MQRKTICRFQAVKNYPQKKSSQENNFFRPFPYLSYYMFFTVSRTISGLFIMLLAGAVYFHLERILFSDASFILTRIINTGSLQIQEHRYGSFITQGFPLLASYSGMPLSAIVLLYSVSFNLFYLAVALLLVYTFREYGLAILMSFYYVLYVSDTYFWTNNEVHQGIAWMFLFFGMISWLWKRRIRKVIFLPVFILLAFLAIFTHPLVAFPTLFLWTFFIFENKWAAGHKELIVYSILLLAICFAKYLLSTSVGQSHYDIEKLEGLQHLHTESVFSALNSTLSGEIIKRTLTQYWIIPILFMTGMVYAIKQKKYANAVLVMVFSMAYFTAIVVTFREFTPFYMESQLMALSIITAALFVYYALPAFKPQQAVMILVLIFMVRLAYIGHASKKWVERKEWIFLTLEDMRKKGIKKGLINEDEQTKKILIMSWGLPQESLLASALNGDDPQMTFISSTPEIIEKRLPERTSQIIGSFENLDNKKLNASYFNIETLGSYKLIN